MAITDIKFIIIILQCILLMFLAKPLRYTLRQREPLEKRGNHMAYDELT